MADEASSISTEKPSANDRVRATRDLLSKLDELKDIVGRSDPALAKTIGALVQAGEKPPQLEDQVFRTRLAYATQDTERHSGRLELPQSLREEMTRLAGSYPGLQNERVLDLVRNIPAIEDRNLIRDIRKLASETASLGNAQQTTDVTGRAEALDGRARLDQGITSKTPSAIVGEQGDRLQASPGSGQSGSSPGKTASQIPSSGPGPTSNESPATSTPVRGTSSGANIFDRILNAVSAGDAKVKEAWDRPMTPMGPRHSDFREAMQGNRDEKVLKAAEVAGSAALEAMRLFANGPANNVMARINEAAKADPEGLLGVLSEMRAGGKYEGLRQQLQGEQALTKGFAEGFERAAAAVGAYGRQRGLADEIGSQRGQVDQISARFEKLDAEVGQRAASLPSPKEGRSMLDDLGEKVKELVVRAIDAVKAAFTPSARRDASASASPSPTP